MPDRRHWGASGKAQFRQSADRMQTECRPYSDEGLLGLLRRPRRLPAIDTPRRLGEAQEQRRRQAEAHLQPCVMEATTMRDGGCNSMEKLNSVKPSQTTSESGVSMVTAVAIVSRAIVSRADLAQAEPDDLRGAVRRAGLAGACETSMRSQRDVKWRSR